MPLLDSVLAVARGAITSAVTATQDRLDSYRSDGWVNAVTGLGTSRDKTNFGFFGAGKFLSDQDLSNLYTYDDLSATIVDTYPQEEMRLGFGLKGLSPENTIEVDRYLKKFDLVSLITDARIWGRCYGGSVIWIMVEDGKDPEDELDTETIKTILGLRVIDKRWVIPQTFYLDGPNIGEPETYLIQEPHPGGVGATIGYIHETRLIRFPGERTETLERIRRRGWDLSVLVKPYEALRQSGETWKAIELLVTDANQGVYKVGHLYEKIAGDTAQGEPSLGDPTGGGAFLKRVQIMDRVKSVFRAIVLDKDEEDYTRLAQTFTGLPDLSDRAWRRVAAAAKIPVPILQGENPAGLNASGTMQLTWFFAKTEQNRVQIDEPRILRIVHILLAAQDAPQIDLDSADTDGETAEDIKPVDKIGVVWLPLWAPTAVELADIRLKRAQEMQILITTQALLPEEGMLSLPEEWWTFDRDLRKKSLEEDAATLLKQKNEATIAQGEASIAGAGAAKDLAENPPVDGNVPQDEGPRGKSQPTKGDMPDNTSVKNATGRKTKPNSNRA